MLQPTSEHRNIGRNEQRATSNECIALNARSGAAADRGASIARPPIRRPSVRKYLMHRTVNSSTVDTARRTPHAVRHTVRSAFTYGPRGRHREREREREGERAARLSFRRCHGTPGFHTARRDSKHRTPTARTYLVSRTDRPTTTEQCSHAHSPKTHPPSVNCFLIRFRRVHR